MLKGVPSAGWPASDASRALTPRWVASKVMAQPVTKSSINAGVTERSRSRITERFTKREDGVADRPRPRVSRLMTAASTHIGSEAGNLEGVVRPDAEGGGVHSAAGPDAIIRHAESQTAEQAQLHAAAD